MLKSPAELIEQDNRSAREGFWECATLRDRQHSFLDEIPGSREFIGYGHEHAGFSHPLQNRHGAAALNSLQPELETFTEASREALSAGVLPAEEFLGYPDNQLLVRDYLNQGFNWHPVAIKPAACHVQPGENICWIGHMVSMRP